MVKSAWHYRWDTPSVTRWGRWCELLTDIESDEHQMRACEQMLERRLFQDLRELGLTPVTHARFHVNRGGDDLFIRGHSVLLGETIAVAVSAP